MSEGVHKTITNAVPFNRRNVPALLGAQSLPRSLRIDGACDDLFERDCGSDLFARAVVKLQVNLGLLPDGKFGRQTYTALLEAADPITLEDNFIVYEGRRYKLDTDNYKVKTFEHADGLDLHRRGHFSRRKKPINRVVVHWGGLNPKHFHAVCLSPVRKVSSHFAIGYDGLGEVVVYQLLDLSHKAWHAGTANDGSIGVDVCQQAATRWRKYYEDDDQYDVNQIDNPSSRGPRKVLSLDPEIERVTRDFLYQLIYVAEDFTEIDSSNYIVEADESLSQIGDSPIVGHHHLKKTKWDIAPWWDRLFGEEDES